MEGPKKEKVEKMFDSIASDYDRLNHIMSFGTDKGWRRRSLKYIVSGKPQNILDIACGTGDYSLAIAKAAAHGTRVHGLDLSSGMLEVMKSKVAASGFESSITQEEGNCEEMAFPDSTFDCAAIGFGIRNFEHRETALREILRVLEPGGRLVILELSVPSNRLIRFFYDIYALHILPVIGGIVSGDPAAYRYLPASIQKFPGPVEWMDTMRRCGYRNVTHKAFTFGTCRMYVGEK